jgi:hypothetical protein
MMFIKLQLISACIIDVSGKIAGWTNGQAVTLSLLISFYSRRNKKKTRKKDNALFKTYNTKTKTESTKSIVFPYLKI